MAALPSLSQLPTAEDLEMIHSMAILTGFADKAQRIRAYRACLLFDESVRKTDFSNGKHISEMKRKAEKEEDKRTIEVDAIRTHGRLFDDPELMKSNQRELAEMLKSIIVESSFVNCRYAQGMNVEYRF